MSPARSGARARLERALLALWFAPEPRGAARAAIVLAAPLSWLVAVVARRRRRRIAALARMRPPVVVVGNLVVGGAGKTPVVIAMAAALQQRGWRPGIIARAYGARADARGAVLRVADTADASLVGDEPLLLARRTGLAVVVGRDRGSALATVLSADPAIDVVISDDGLQHPGLRRDFELVVLDARGLGNGRVLPAGPLREAPSALAAADAVLVADDAATTVVHPKLFGRSIVPTGFRHLASGRTLAPEAFAGLAAGRDVTAFAAIAQPRRFFEMLHGLGVHARSVALADHAAIEASWLAALGGELVVMTEKDAVKCERIADDRCWCLCIDARLDEALIDFVEDSLRGP